MENRNRKNIPQNEGMHESNLRQTGKTQVSMDDSIPMPPQKKKKKKKTSKFLVAVLVVFIVAVLAVAGYAASIFFLYEPPAGNVNNELPFVPTPESGENNEQVEIEVQDKQYNFLVVARDKVSGLTDVMMSINYNITDQSLSVMEIPRVTYVEVEDYYYHKINGAFSYYQSGRRGEEDDHRGALRDVAASLEQNL